jgi:hypothetical protein
MKPSEMACDVPVCPVCGKPGEGVEYKASDPYLAAKYMLEFIVNHSINDQTKGRQKDSTRNNFCYTGYVRRASDDEIQPGWRASPTSPPDWPHIKKELEKKNGRQSTL